MKQIVITNRLTNRESDVFIKYLKDISAIELFTPEEEINCAKKVAMGDLEAKNELIKRNLRFVISVANQYASTLNPVEDLVNEGNIGLIMAAEKFNPEMGIKFISYAVWWIQKLIHEHLSKHSRMVRLPANKLNNLSTLDKRINQLEQKLGRSVDISEVIAEFQSDFGDDNYEDISMLKTYKVDSMDREISSFGDSITTVGDLMADDNIESATDHLVASTTIKEDINNALNILKPRDKRVMVALYGLDGNCPMTLAEVGELIGVTHEMIRQIKAKSLRMLKDQVKLDLIKNA